MSAVGRATEEDGVGPRGRKKQKLEPEWHNCWGNPGSAAATSCVSREQRVWQKRVEGNWCLKWSLEQQHGFESQPVLRELEPIQEVWKNGQNPAGKAKWELERRRRPCCAKQLKRGARIHGVRNGKRKLNTGFCGWHTARSLWPCSISTASSHHQLCFGIVSAATGLRSHLCKAFLLRTYSLLTVAFTCQQMSLCSVLPGNIGAVAILKLAG